MTNMSAAIDTLTRRRVDDPDLVRQLNGLIEESGGDSTSRHGRLVRDLLATSLKLITDRRHTGELKLLTNSFKEMRHAYRVFGGYNGAPRVSIFGSARTPADHPDYQTAVSFSRMMAEQGWLVITGAGEGIMKAGHEGPGPQNSFGLSIRLPFETTANSVISGDHKLINFRYFFTRKLMFLSQSQAITAFPGGFGTQDELLEALTLIQTGKSAVVPVVLIEGPDSNYWERWDRYVREELLGGGFLSPADTSLYYLAIDAQDAVDHITRFFSNYHSSRYVGRELVLRLRSPLTTRQLRHLNREFADLVEAGEIYQRPADDIEGEYLDLPRLAFTHTRASFGRLRQLIDRVNDYALDNGRALDNRGAADSGRALDNDGA